MCLLATILDGIAPTTPPPVALWNLYALMQHPFYSSSINTYSFLYFLFLSLHLNNPYLGFPDSSVGKEPACNAGDPSSIPESGRSPGEGTGYPLQYSWASLVAQLVKNLPAMRETYVRSLGWEDLLEKGLHDMISSYFHGRSFFIPQTKWCGFHRHFCLPHYSTGCTFWLW